MSRKPNLGTDWKEAIQSAYAHGYSAFEYSCADIIDEVREIAVETTEREAVDVLMNEYDWFISESKEHKALWRAIDDFYKNHMPEEEYEQLQREAAVAEDLDSAFSAGALDAILGREYNIETVEHLHA